MSLLELFFEVQDIVDVGCPSADEALSQLIEEAGAITPCCWPQDAILAEPPPSIIVSAALNARAELQLDAAGALGFPLLAQSSLPVREAMTHLNAALALWPQNATAAMSLALLCRDRGDADRALELWRMVSSLPLTHATEATVVDGPSYAFVEGCSGGEAYDWVDAFVYDPRRRCVPLATMHHALLASNVGEYTDADAAMVRLGFRWRLSHELWDAARRPVAATVLSGDPDGDETPGPISVFPDAVPAPLLSQLRTAFAPGAAYWSETSYNSASAEKRYFTFYVDLTSPAGVGDNAVDRLVKHLHHLTGRDDLVGAEWWVHSRVAGRGVGHELHWDVEETLMEAGGGVVRRYRSRHAILPCCAHAVALCSASSLSLAQPNATERRHH
jgi:hypothetical protein